MCVLGLATGSSPITIYSELVRLHKEENLSFKNVITFNLDEYWPMNKNSRHSYHKLMFDNLFNHIDIDKKNINIPNGNVSPNKLEKHCIKFENKIFFRPSTIRTNFIGFIPGKKSSQSKNRTYNKI